MTVSEAAARITPRMVFAQRGFAFYWGARICAGFAIQIINVAVGWWVYELTRDPFQLGLVGLVEFTPALALMLVTGAAADRYPRRLIMAACIALMGGCALALLALAAAGTKSVLPIFAVLFMFGLSRAFFNPAAQSLVPNLVPPAYLNQAIALNSSINQTASVVGPIVGGLLYDLYGTQAPFWVAAVLSAVALALVLVIRPLTRQQPPQRRSLSSLLDGFRYIWREKMILGAISLDLFAVLLGGAVALLPVFALEILQAGPWALGLLRAAPGVGAVTMALLISFRPLHDHVGAYMLGSVAMFGVAITLFGLSDMLWLSLFALMLSGAADSVSVIIRITLVQIETPDALRGRVNAVNSVFIGASNEIGAFRAGTMAAVIGAVPAVVVGGVGAVLLAGGWAMLFPELRRVRRFSGDQ